MVGSTRIRALRCVAWICAVLCVAVVALTATARSTVLSAGFHRSVLADEHAYDRLYNQVLVDPRITPVTRDLLGRLPVPEAVLTSNLKTVLPPETLRALTDQQIGHLVDYLRGNRDDLRLSVDLRPVIANITGLTRAYFGDMVSSLQEQKEPDFPAFLADLKDAVGQVGAGRPPEGLPTLALTEAQAATAADALLRAAPEDVRGTLRPEVTVALQNGDVATALAAVGPAAFSERTRAAAARLRTVADGGTWDIAADLELDEVRQVRAATHLTLDVVEPLAAALGIAALATLWFTGPDSRPRRLRHLGWALAAGGLCTALVALVILWTVGRRPVDVSAAWPESAARLLDDLQATAVDRFLAGMLTAALVPVVAGALLVGLAWAGERRRAPVRAWRPGLWPAAGATALALAGVALVPIAFSDDTPRSCQGSPRLCDRRYDEVAQLTSHNAMSTTADKFIGPLQDPLIADQLDAGVRALQLDTYRWERPEEVTGRLDESDFPPELRRQITAAVQGLNPPRPGLWLCHSVCRAGAIELVPTLRQIGDWLRANPGDVVTLIVQDALSGEETEGAFREAGLRDLLFTPDEDPDRPWPTLGEMIDSGRRLVVFAERADGPAPWYRNFYRYAMETPFAFRAPADLSCVPHRGGTGKRLFLLNHFITADGGSRLDAGEINTRRAVLDRAHRCERVRGAPVNFVAIDYLTVGDAKAAVDRLNAERD
ncbi:hypothetical protein ACFW9L_27920 [Streptomyces sp. NPDC059517]|uniref:hypothetical protein n=1 Tax=Streptomyces sp. NPDC059517 TaxID=3346855 RepID=UPI003686DD24